MSALIVEKDVIILDGNGRRPVTKYAVVSNQPHPLAQCYSLTYEGYVGPWREDRGQAESDLDWINHNLTAPGGAGRGK